MYLRTWNRCLKIYELDPAKFISAHGLAWHAPLKKTQRKISSFNWYRYIIDDRKTKQKEIF